MIDRDEFISDRDAALLSMNRLHIEAYARKYDVQLPDEDGMFWSMIHKARTGATTLPMAERAASKLYLWQFGWQGMDDGEVMPPSDMEGWTLYMRRIQEFGCVPQEAPAP